MVNGGSCSERLGYSELSSEMGSQLELFRVSQPSNLLILRGLIRQHSPQMVFSGKWKCGDLYNDALMWDFDMGSFDHV